MIIVCKHTSIPGYIDGALGLFTVGERVEEQFLDLTIGKKYVLHSEEYFNDKDTMVEVIDDSGGKHWYPKDNFMALNEWRESKLDKLI